MAIEPIILKMINSIQKNAAGQCETGLTAIASGSNAPARGYVTDRILMANDIIRIPAMAGNDDDVNAWLFAPAVTEGKPVLHCVCKVTRGSASLAVPIFIGNFVKEVTATDGNIHRNTVTDRSGQPIDLTTTCADIGEQWRLLAGRTFRIKTVTPVKTMRRNRRTMVAYEGTANIYEIVEV